MSRNPFGWDYPAGAEHDPNAPWNQDDNHCPRCCPFGMKEDPEPICTECAQVKGDGICWLWAIFPTWLAYRLSRIQFLYGLFDRYCNFAEQECACGDCDCDNEPDYDAMEDERRDREFEDSMMERDYND